MTTRPFTGLAVIIRKHNKVLLGKRKNAHGEGTWAFPGGHLEYQESFEDCARREVLEETGLEVVNLKFGAITNDVFKKEEKHYVTIFMVCDYHGGEEECKEPDKCEQWEWFAWDDLPQPLFLCFQNLLKQGYNPFKN